MSKIPRNKFNRIQGSPLFRKLQNVALRNWKINRSEGIYSADLEESKLSKMSSALILIHRFNTIPVNSQPHS